MNKELCVTLKNKLIAANIPYLTQIAGMVQTVEYAEENADGNKMTFRMPVSYDTNEVPCATNGEQKLERALVPDSSKAGIVYFEDLGVVFDKDTSYGVAYKSNLILVCWLNKEKITGDPYSQITAQVVNDIMNAFGRNPFNEMPFVRVQVLMDRIQPQDASVFAKYSYSESVNQYLMPPFEHFALSLTVKFVVSRKCVLPISMNPNNCGEVAQAGDYDKAEYNEDFFK